MEPALIQANLSQQISMQKGFTLIEVIISLGIMVIVLPATTLFLLQLIEEQTEAKGELQMEQTASLLLSELRTEIAEAASINISSSTLGSDNGVLVFVDRAGETVTIDRPTVGAVRRLRLQRGVGAAVYLTSSTMDVETWRIDAARTDDDETLTGLQFSVDFALLNPQETIYRDLTFAGDTTIALSPQTTEL